MTPSISSWLGLVVILAVLVTAELRGCRDEADLIRILRDSFCRGILASMAARGEPSSSVGDLAIPEEKPRCSTSKILCGDQVLCSLVGSELGLREIDQANGVNGVCEYL